MPIKQCSARLRMPRPQVILSKFRSPDRDPMNRKQVTDTDPVTGLRLRWFTIFELLFPIPNNKT